MSTVRIIPSRASGIITAPPSKSMAVRALICAALAEGESRIGNLLLSEDIQAAVSALRSFGAGISYDAAGGTAAVTGADLSRPPVSAVIDCRESASVLRFMIPLCLLRGGRVRLAGSRRLFERPLGVYEDLFKQDGIYYRKTEHGIELEGKLAGGDYTVRGDISSQFITGLLLALPASGKESSITVTGRVQSRPYIAMTLQMQELFGVSVKAEETAEAVRYRIGGECAYRNAVYETEGDWSNAAYLDLLNIPGNGCLQIAGLNGDSLQGDRIYRDYYERIKRYDPAGGKGAAVSRAADMPSLDISDCPDLGPALIAAAALCHGAVLTGTARLAFKESDRGQAMAEELAKCGVGITVNEDSIIVPDCPLKAPAVPLSGHNDHRIVMALSALASAAGGVIEGAEAVKKSFPGYFEIIGKAGIDLRKVRTP